MCNLKISTLLQLSNFPTLQLHSATIKHHIGSTEVSCLLLKFKTRANSINNFVTDFEFGKEQQNLKTKSLESTIGGIFNFQLSTYEELSSHLSLKMP